MSCAVDNNAFEVTITPSRKRKRDSGRELASSALCSSIKIPSAFANAAFASTPKKEIKSLIQKFNRFPSNQKISLGKENGNPFPADPCLEVKSILDLVANQKADVEPENPFEVVRKPPKKRKKTDIEEACFVNPGLNLELPEKQFNPFEVIRDSPTKLVKADESQCFINPALNIRSQEITAARNPFEIPRMKQITETTPQGIENQGLDLVNGPLRIEIPFKPTVGCRIDFNNLTPSKMLAEKLIFSPKNSRVHRVLADIIEEETIIDIGKELDRYQLELENSINEAKQKKGNVNGLTLCEKLQDIIENSQEEEQEEIAAHEPKTPEPSTALKSSLKKEQSVLRLEDVETPPVQKVPEEDAPSASNISVHMVNKTFVKEPNHDSFTDDEGIDYDIDDDDDVIDFKAPAPFVRAYRKEPPQLTVSRSRKSLESKEEESLVIATENKSKVKNIIRNSIRRLIHPKKSPSKDKIEKKPQASSEHLSTGHHIMDTIRHSLRRRTQKQTVEENVINTREISIIDTTERNMKFKSNLIQTEYINIEKLATERKCSLRSSIRKSSRDVKNQIMKSVFHKNNEEYALSK